MFTGIIRHTGQLTFLEALKPEENVLDNALNIEISSELFKTNKGSMVGDSISVQGVCLTVVEPYSCQEGKAIFNISSETLRRTTFEGLYNNQSKNPLNKILVHLERSLTLGDQIDGHLVYGHVDTIAEVTSIKEEGETWRFEFTLNSEAYPFLAEKGSISIDGVSLTIGEVSLVEKDKREGGSEVIFGVYIIPHTYHETCFSSYELGSIVNIEYDPLARYAVHALKSLRQN